jgi:Plasmid encoded RepA protein
MISSVMSDATGWSAEHAVGKTCWIHRTRGLQTHVVSVSYRSFKWRKTLDSVGKSLAISRMSKFLKILQQPAMNRAFVHRPEGGVVPITGAGETWRKAGHKVSLLVEPGTMLVKGREIRYGVPYGARARVILLFLQTQAVKTRSREIQLGRSMYDWMERMCVSVGGETARALKEQAARISACSLKFFWENGTDEGWAAGRIVASGLRFNAKASAQGRLWDDCVLLDEAFYKALEDHSVPLQEAAIRELHDRSMSLDLYVWLAWRLHVLSKPVSVSWPALYGQFGAGYSKISHFKPRFTEALAAAVAAYPQCKVAVDAESGLTLHPSPPPVSRLLAAS